MTTSNCAKLWEKYFGDAYSAGIVQNPKLEAFLDELTAKIMKTDIGKTIHFRKPLIQNEFDELIGVITGVKDNVYIVNVSGATFFVPQSAVIEIC